MSGTRCHAHEPGQLAFLWLTLSFRVFARGSFCTGEFRCVGEPAAPATEARGGDVGLRGGVGELGSVGRAAWRARVRGPAHSQVAGAATVLADGTLLTCAHVVEAALGLPPAQPTHNEPAGTVLVDFPHVAHGQYAEGEGAAAPSVRARVAPGGWLRHRPAADLALLEPERPLPPEAAGVAPRSCGTGELDCTVAVCGYPRAAPSGLWARAKVAGPGGPHPAWRQLDGLDRAAARVERGFSGAGVWDADHGGVIGVLAAVLVTGAPDHARVAWMIPSEALSEVLSEVLDDGGGGNRGVSAGRLGGGVPGNSAPSAPPGSDARPAGALWPLVECLLTMDSVAADGGTQLLSLLPAGIAGGVPRHSRPRLQLFHIVRRCTEFEAGPAALVEVVQWMEGETTTVKRFVEHAQALWQDRLDGHG